MIILGIDPGLAIVGWGVIEAHRGQFRPIACGDINTPAHTSVESRLKIIYDELNRIIGKYKPKRTGSRSTNTRPRRSSRRSSDTAKPRSGR